MLDRFAPACTLLLLLRQEVLEPALELDAPETEVRLSKEQEEEPSAAVVLDLQEACCGVGKDADAALKSAVVGAVLFES